MLRLQGELAQVVQALAGRRDQGKHDHILPGPGEVTQVLGLAVHQHHVVGERPARLARGWPEGGAGASGYGARGTRTREVRVGERPSVHALANGPYSFLASTRRRSDLSSR